MRRKDRELTDPGEIRAVLEKAEVCHLAMSDGGVPYLVTMNFGIKGDGEPVLYFHYTGEGKKIDVLKRNNVVCFGADVDRELLPFDHGDQLRLQHEVPQREGHGACRLRGRRNGKACGPRSHTAAL